MTVLISGGDSFTAGNELPSPEHAWPALLAERRGWNHCATARGGNSNSAIRRTVMNAVHKYLNEDLFVAVMWSFPNRYEFRFTYDTGQKDSPWYSINPWTYDNSNFVDYFHNLDEVSLKYHKANRANAEKLGISNFARTYINNVAESEYWELYTSWSEIVMLQNYLLQNKIPFRFMYVDNCLFECNYSDISLRTLRESIDNDWFVCDEGMYDWAKRTKQDFYTTHPKESAHVEWINMLYDRII